MATVGIKPAGLLRSARGTRLGPRVSASGLQRPAHFAAAAAMAIVVIEPAGL